MQAAFARAIAQYGFDKFSFVQVLGPNRNVIDPEMLFGHQHENWNRIYAERKFYFDDPSLKKILQSLAPFAWSDTPLIDQKREEQNVFLAAAEMGLQDGFVVPIEGVQRELFVVRLTTPEKKFDPAVRTTLYALSLMYSTIGLNKFGKPQQTSPHSPLTSREAECLRWVSEGKSDWDISEILGISQHTVHEHLERGKAKLKARTRTQAAVHAAINGWLSNPPDQGTGIKN
jgi:LuxR family quorum sensing-dependent transcriptional regulator